MATRGETTSSRPATRALSPSLLTRFGLWIVWSPDVKRVGRCLDSPTQPLAIGRDESAHIVVADRWMSRHHFELSAAGGQLVVTDLGTRNGTWHNGRRVQRALLRPGDLVRAGGTLFAAGHGFDPGAYDLGIVGLSGALAEVRHQIHTLARSTVMKSVGASLETRRIAQPVHITGETGVGKELVAGALHRLSGRDGAFVTRNVATIPRDLVATELFGHSRGAFTGAERDRAGLFQTAEGGTLFLDEIAETSDPVQASLLTVLDGGNVMTVGSARTTRVDVRTVTATHRDLAQLVTEGRFRQDLFHRLTTATITVPPLRTRRLDVPILAAHFLQLGSDALDRIRASPDAMYWMADALEALRESPWAGNARQLQGWVGHVSALVARGLPTSTEPWPDPASFAAMVPIRPAIPVEFELGGAFPAPEVTPAPGPEALQDDTDEQPDQERCREAAALFADADTLEAGLAERFNGNVAALARWAAPGLGLRDSAARRRIYDVLGADRIAALRGRPGGTGTAGE